MDFQLRNSSGQEIKVSGSLKDLEPVLYKLFINEGYHIMSINGKTAKQMQRENAKRLEDLQKKVNPKPSKREQRRRIDEIIENRSKKVVGPDETKAGINDCTGLTAKISSANIENHFVCPSEAKEKNFTGAEFAAGIITGDKIRSSAERVQQAIREAGNRADK